MKEYDKSVVVGICLGAIIVSIAVTIIFGSTNIMEKLDEVPQYNCHILEKQMDKYGHDPTIYRTLQSNWVDKECYK